jgi:hypothetical protein
MFGELFNNAKTQIRSKADFMVRNYFYLWGTGLSENNGREKTDMRLGPLKDLPFSAIQRSSYPEPLRYRESRPRSDFAVPVLSGRYRRDPSRRNLPVAAG